MTDSPRMTTDFSSALRRLWPRIELLLLLLLAPLLIFPQPAVAPWLLGLIPLLWACRWVAQGRLTVRTPLDVPLLILLIMTLVGLAAAYDPARSLPKVCGLLLGVALFYAMVNGIRTRRGLWLAAALILAGGAAMAAASLVGAHWAGRKSPLLFPFLSAVYERVPTLLQGVPRAERGFNANQVAGALTLFVPLAAVLLLHAFRRRSSPILLHVLLTLGLAAALGLTAFTLLLTQSRMAYVAVSLALLLSGATLGRWPRRVVLVLLLVGIGLLVYHGPDRVGQALFGVPNLESLAEETSWVGRVEIWRRSLRVIRDHPLTGIGFDALFPVIHARYPTFLIPAGRDATHAHNLFLQTGLDLGLPGLAAFAWLLLAFWWMMAQVWRRAPSAADGDRAGALGGPAALAAGLGLGLLAQMTFGLADAIALGQKPGVFTWAILGLGAALWTLDVGRRTSHAGRWTLDVRRRTSDVKRRTAIVCSLLLLPLLLVAVWGYGRVNRARAWLALLEADLEALQTLSQGSGGGVEAAAALLHQTRADLLGLQSELALPLALAPRLGWLPVYGPDLAAAPRLLQMGLDLTAAGEGLVEPLAGLADAPPAVALDGLRAARPDLARALATLEQVQQTRRAIRADALSPRLREGVAQFDRLSPLLEHAAWGAMALPDLLGGDRPRTYLILVQNDDELRPTGGFISGVARVVLSEGQVVNLTFEDSYAVDDFSKAYPLAPRPMREVMGPAPWVFRDSNWSPDFPTAAEMALQLYGLRYGVDIDDEIDGVVAIDQETLRLVVEAIGPLTVLEHPEPLTGDNVIQAVRQSWAPAEGQGLTAEWRAQRKDFMGRLLTAAVNELRAGEVDLAALGGAVLQALEERHLFVYVPGEGGAALRRAGWDGALHEGPGDYLMLVDANLGFNKVNPYVTERLSYAVDLRELDRPRAVLTVTHRHNGPDTGAPVSGAPCRHESRYDLTYEQMMARCYWDYVRVYAPGESRLLEATRRPIPGRLLLTGEDRAGDVEVLRGEGGRTVFATFLVLAPGERTETRFVYDLPADVLEALDDVDGEGGWRYRLYVQKQGGTDARPVRVTLLLPVAAEVIASSPPPTARVDEHLVYEMQLSTDLEIVLQWREAGRK